MLHVNLIRERALAETRVTRAAMVCLVIVAVTVVGALLIVGRGKFRVSGLAGETRKFEEKTKALSADAEDVGKKQDKLKEHEPLVAMVRESEWSSVDWLRMLMSIHRDLPDTVWLTAITSTFDAPTWRQNVRFEGTATRHAEVGAVMDAIARTNMFSNDGVKLTQTNEVQVGENATFTQFVIDAQLQYVIGENIH